MYEVNWDYAVNGLERADIRVLIGVLNKLEQHPNENISDLVKKCAKNTAESLRYYLDNPIVIDSPKKRQDACILAQQMINELVWLSGAFYSIYEIQDKKEGEIYAQKFSNPDFKYEYDKDFYEIYTHLCIFAWGGHHNEYNKRWYSLFAKEFSTKPVGWAKLFLG